jgi:uncharacterized protein (TIGR02996 family)
MSDREALMRAICENPDDDTPRLVFADWLDEHGEPERAEFIRVQIEADRQQPFTIPWFKLNKRGKQLLDTHELRWRTEVPTDDMFRWRWFRHGFLDQLIALDFDSFHIRAAEVFTAAPIRELHLGLVRSLTQLGTIPFLNRPIRIRVFAGWVTPEDVVGFLSSPGGRAVRRIEFLNWASHDEPRQLLLEGLRGRVEFPIV